MRNYAGHRLAPWLAHVMVSQHETARPLLTTGKIMQLPATDALVLFSSQPPIRAVKLRYYEDPAFQPRVLAPPAIGIGLYPDRPAPRVHDRQQQVRATDVRLTRSAKTLTIEGDEGGHQFSARPK